MWNLWWTKRHCDRFFFRAYSFCRHSLTIPLMFQVHSSIIPGQWSQHRPHLCWDSVSSHHGNKRERSVFTLVVLPAVPVTVNTSSTDTLVAESSIYITLLLWLMWNTFFLSVGIYPIESCNSNVQHCLHIILSLEEVSQSTPIHVFRTHIINFTMPWNTFILKSILVWNVILASHVTQPINCSF
jgi:hypothetical protein